MMTPLEIQKKDFKKGLNGYNKQEVNEFVDKVYYEFDKIYRENAELRSRLDTFNEKLESYQAIEKTLQSTLIIAQTTSDEVIANARKKGEMAIVSAEEEASKIIENAHNNTITLRTEYEQLRKEMQVFKVRFKSLLEAELESLSGFEA